jgi:hypothetical protein
MVFPAETASEEEEALPGAAGAGDGGEVSTVEWPQQGTSAPLPAEVADVVRQLLDMEFVACEKMRFGGPGSKIKVKIAFFFFFLQSPVGSRGLLLLLLCSTQQELNPRECS